MQKQVPRLPSIDRCVKVLMYLYPEYFKPNVSQLLHICYVKECQSSTIGTIKIFDLSSHCLYSCILFL